MKRNEFAKKLNGCQYRNELTEEDEKFAKDSGMVVVFGASDDLMEFRGAIYDEVSAWEGGSAFVTKDGMLENDCDNEDCPCYEREKEKAQEIRAIWDTTTERGENVSWLIKTDIPHITFNVMEDDEIYCVGLVFLLADVQ